MPPAVDPAEDPVEATNSRLIIAMRNCRAMVGNYRTFIAGNADPEIAAAASDQPTERLANSED